MALSLEGFALFAQIRIRRERAATTVGEKISHPLLRDLRLGQQNEHGDERQPMASIGSQSKMVHRREMNSNESSIRQQIRKPSRCQEPKPKPKPTEPGQV